ncbi:MAG TPA: hypothetical protein VNV42_09555 [Solirubrobacteraceae bacterium]|jgi:hypothetical protein|nr:hypothetical protein [Solirubrobacteraceae bacterium]
MNDTPVIERLRHLNPLPEEPGPPPIAPLLEQLDESVRSLHDPIHTEIAPVPRHARLRRPLAFAGAAACGIALGGLVLSAIPGGGGTFDVAAAMYRALTPGAGVLHMTTITERTVGGQAATTMHEQLWTAQKPRRMRIVMTDPEGEVSESALDTAPLKLLQWSQWQPDVIKQSAPAGVDMTERSPVEVLRGLYAKGELTVAGKTTLDGHAVWQLEVHPSAPMPALNGRQLPNPEVVVDASTFVPLEFVEEGVVDEHGTPELQVSKERYSEYQELGSTAQNEALLQLGEHPGAHVQNEG